MKNKKKVIIIITVLLSLCIVGVVVFCVVDNLRHRGVEPTKDLFVGYYVTTESGLENEKVAETITEDYRYYASFVDKNQISEYVFEGLDGYSCFYYYEKGGNSGNSVSANIDDVFINDHQSILEGGDCDYKINADMYICGEESCVFVNPVYQTNDGDIYTILGSSGEAILSPGSGVTFPGSDSKLAFKRGELKICSSEMNMTIHHKDTLKEVSITEFTNENIVIKTEKITSPEVLKDYSVSENAEFLIMDTVYQNKNGGLYTEKELFVIGEDGCYIYITDKNGVYKKIWF